MPPTIAYAGEIDGQKQASDMMEKAMAAEGLKMERLIGPKTGHKYEPETRKQLDKRLAEICDTGRNPRPWDMHFTTWTLRYNRMYWLTVDSLARHWERARVDKVETGAHTIEIRTSNVTGLTLNTAAIPVQAETTVIIDGQVLFTATDTTKGPPAAFARSGDIWKKVTEVA